VATIGPTFADELREAGLAGLPFSWTPDGLHDTSQLRPDQLDAVNAVLAVHDPSAPPIPQGLTQRQFHQALAMQGKITEQEALDAVKIGTVPSEIQFFIDTLPTDEQFPAKMKFAVEPVVSRYDSVMEQFGKFQGWTAAEMNDFWRFAATL
jgi:hypothetical protein